MSGRAASSVLLAICIVIVVLLMAKVINPLTAGVLFAVALAALGIASRGFRRTGSV